MFRINHGIMGYNVYLDSVKVNASLIADLTYLLTGLSGETSYSVAVEAVDSSSNTAMSDTIQFTTPTIVSVALIQDEHKVYAYDNTIVISTSYVPETIAVYNMLGSVIEMLIDICI